MMDKITITPEMHKLVEQKLEEMTKHWTPEDFTLQSEAMKNISSKPIWNSIHQIKKWALIEARASVVKVETEEERKVWFDKEIEFMDNLIKQTDEQ